MPVIAITGGIGAGKSTVRRMFEDLGACAIDADELAREVVKPGTEGAGRLKEAFGEEFFDSEDKLDRRKMAAKVFAQPEARAEIERILHPLIRDAERVFVEEVRRRDPAAVVIVEIPLLAEGGRSGEYDGIVLVTAPEEVRVSRLVSAGRYDKGEARARMANQAGDEEREKLADWIVDNSRDLEETERQVEEIYRKLATGQ